MKKKKMIFLFLFVVLMISTSVIIYKNGDKISLKYHLHHSKTEYVKNPSDNNLLNYYFYLSLSDNIDECAKYGKQAIEYSSIDSIKNSEFNEYYNTDAELNPKDFMLCYYLTDMLDCKGYDCFREVFVEYYPQVDYKTQLTLSNLIVLKSNQSSDVSIIEMGILAYSELASITDDEIIKSDCIQQIISLRNEAKSKDADISIDNNFLRSMTFDGEHIPITVDDKIIRYYCVSTGEYVEKI